MWVKVLINITMAEHYFRSKDNATKSMLCL